MSSFPEVGVRLVAENEANYVQSLERATSATTTFAQGVTQSASSANRSFEEIRRGAEREIGAKIVGLFEKSAQAMLQFGKESVAVAGNYQSTTNMFGAVTGKNAAEVEKFSKVFLQMGKDTEFSAKEAAQAAVELAKGGMPMETTAKAAVNLQASLALASAGQVDLAQSAELLAKQMGVWGEDMTNATEVVDLLAQAANASVADVSSLGYGLANVGGVAKIAGLSFRETVTSLAMISPGFSSASDAGTSFKTFLTNLQPHSKESTKAMIELGLATQDGASKFYDAQGNFIGMAAASDLLMNATKDLTQAEKIKTLSIIFGSDAIRVATQIAENGSAGYEKMTQSMDKAGSATEQAKQMNQGYDFAMQQLQGSVETLQITLGTQLLPTFEKIAGEGATLVNSVTDLVAGGMNLDSVFVGLAGAASVWALANTTTLIPSIVGVGKAAAAAALEAGALALVATAIYGVYEAGKGYLEEYEKGWDALRQKSDWYAEAAGLLNEYNAASKTVKDSVVDQMNEVHKLEQAWQSSVEKYRDAQEDMVNLGATADAEGKKLLQNKLDNAKKEVDAADQALKAKIGITRKEIQETQTFENRKTELARKGIQDRADAWTAYAESGGKVEDVVRQTEDAEVGLVQQTALTTDEIANLAKELSRIANEAANALSSLFSLQTGIYDNLESAESQHQQAIEGIMKSGGGGGGGGGRVNVQKQINDELLKLQEETDQSLLDLEKSTQEKLLDIDTSTQEKILDIDDATSQKQIDIDQSMQDKLVEIDRKAAEDRAESYRALNEEIITSSDAMVAAQEANDLDLVGIDEKQKARLMAREQAERAARERMVQATAEAKAIAEQGDAEHAKAVLAIRQDAIRQQQSLDEAYARRQAELADNPEALAQLKQQYDEATAAIQLQTDNQLGIAQSASDQRKQKAEEEKLAVVDSAMQQKEAVTQQAEQQKQELLDEVTKQKAEILAEAEIQKNEIIAKAEAQKNEILTKERETGAGRTGSAKSSLAERKAAEDAAHTQRLVDMGIAYVAEEEKQRQHLGQMLLDWTTANQKQLGLTDEQLAALQGKITTHYGIQKDESQKTWDQMTSDITTFATTGSTDLDGLMLSLDVTTEAGGLTKDKMAELAKTMVEETTKAYQDGKLTAEEYDKALRAIPSRINTMLDIEIKIKNLDQANRDAARLHGATPSYAVGTDFHPGGLAEIHKDELVFLPRGSAVATKSESASIKDMLLRGGIGGWNIGSVVDNRTRELLPTHSIMPISDDKLAEDAARREIIRKIEDDKRREWEANQARQADEERGDTSMWSDTSASYVRQAESAKIAQYFERQRIQEELYRNVYPETRFTPPETSIPITNEYKTMSSTQTVNKYYSLSVTSMAQSRGIIGDFAYMEALAHVRD